MVRRAGSFICGHKNLVLLTFSRAKLEKERGVGRALGHPSAPCTSYGVEPAGLLSPVRFFHTNNPAISGSNRRSSRQGTDSSPLAFPDYSRPSPYTSTKSLFLPSLRHQSTSAPCSLFHG